MEETLNTHNNPANSNIVLAAVVIEVFDDGDDILENVILEKYTNYDFKDRIMNGTHPDDNFINTEYIPNKEGVYLFDVEYNGGADFNGESIEYFFECRLLNCRLYNIC